MKIAVVGGGAAGLFFAANVQNHNVIVFEHSKEVGKKLLLTGGGRCNLTNVQQDFLSGVYCGRQFLRSALSAFGAQELMGWFESRGVELKTQQGGRVFPKSNSANEVLQCLKRVAKENGTKFVFVDGVKIKQTPTGFLVNDMAFDCVVLATGGKSFSATGSDGSGVALAKSLGLKTTEFQPRLMPILARGTAPLMGVSVSAQISLTKENIVLAKESGDVLFAHFGLTGPAVLNVTSQLKELPSAGLRAKLNLLPKLDESSFLCYVQEYRAQNPKNGVRKMVSGLLPTRLADQVLEHAGLAENKRVSELSKSEIKKLYSTAHAFEFQVDGFLGFDSAWVSRGGVNVEQINPKTMQAKNNPNLFVIGELLNVDGQCGGYNLQIAFSTAFAAAMCLENQK